MNAGKGTAKTEAIAEVLTTLVEKHRSCEPMMADMMKTMRGMGGNQSPATPTQPPDTRYLLAGDREARLLERDLAASEAAKTLDDFKSD